MGVHQNWELEVGGTADFESLVGLASGVVKGNIKKHCKGFQYFWKFIR